MKTQGRASTERRQSAALMSASAGGSWSLRARFAPAALPSLFVALLLALSAPLAAQTVHTVGPDPGCDFGNLQSAINAVQDFDEIRLMTGTYYGGYTIHSRAVRIVGGFPDCASSTPTGRSTFDQQGSGLVLDVYYPAASNDASLRVELENLTIRGGGGSGFSSGGVSVRGRPGKLAVRFSDVQISENTRAGLTDHGAGLRVLATGDRSGTSLPLAWLGDGSAVIGNTTAGNGGGIYCQSEYSSLSGDVLRFEQGLIFDNEAGSNGGGIAVNGCFPVVVQSGGPIVLFFPTGGIIGNRAARGGGIYLENDGRLGLYASPDHAALLAENEATILGGGAAVSGAGSFLQVRDGYLSGNSAAAGGAIAVQSGGLVRVRRTLATPEVVPCKAPIIGGGSLSRPPCSVIEDNQADGGGAFDLRGDAVLEVNQSIIRGNQSGSGGGAVLSAGNTSIYTGPNSEARFEGVVVEGNSGGALFRASNNARIRIVHGTVASYPGALFQTAAAADKEARIEVHASIVEGSGSWRLDGGDGTTALELECVIGNAMPAVTGADALVAYSQIDPRFIDPTDGDYRLRSDSPAIDYCGPSGAPSYPDLDGYPRGQPWTGPAPIPAPGGGLGPYDLGAYETPFDPVGLLFRDRFEQ